MASPGEVKKVAAGSRILGRPGSGHFAIICAQGVTAVGSQVTALALPAVAILEMNVRPFTATLLIAATFLPSAVLTPVIGVWVDRAKLRHLLIWSETIQVVVLGTVPIMAAIGRLHMGILYMVAVLSGILTGFTDLGVQTAAPRLVLPDRLVNFNAHVAGAKAVGQIAGPALGGLLISLIGAAYAITVDSISFAASAALLCLLPATLNAPLADLDVAKRSVLADLRDGYEVVRHTGHLLQQTLCAGAFNLGSSAINALMMVYAYRNLHLSAIQIGITFAGNSAATFAAIGCSSRLFKRFATIPLISVCALGAAASLLLIPLASVGFSFPILLGYEIVFGFLATIWSVSMATNRQQISPPGTLGRVNAFMRTAMTITMPIGALVGGALANSLGLLPVIVTGAFISVGAALALALAQSLWHFGGDSDVQEPQIGLSSGSYHSRRATDGPYTDR